MLVPLLALWLAADVDDVAGPTGVRLGAAVGAGVVGRDVVAGVDVAAGVDTKPFALFVRAPLLLRLADGAPFVEAAAPSYCAWLRCEELLSGESLDASALARLVDEVRLFTPGDVVFARAGGFVTTLGHGASLDRFTTAASWDRRTSGVVAALRLPWPHAHHPLAVDLVVGDVLRPLELLAARVDAPLADDGPLAALHAALEGAADVVAPDEAVDRAGLLIDAAATRPLTSSTLEVALALDGDVVDVTPRLEGSVVTGLSADGGDVGRAGAGAGVGVDVGVDAGVVDVTGHVTASWGTAGYRRAVFQTLHAVERRQALTGSVVDDDGRARGLVHVPAPGGPGLDVRLQASIASIVAPLVRAHLETAPGGNAVEAGVVVDVEPVQVSVTALRRGFVDVAGVFSADVARAPVVGVLEASVRFFGPLSLGVRWWRLPRFVGDGTLRIDDDIFVTLSANTVLAPR